MVLALTVLIAPAVGVPHDEMVPDTLKSIVVALGVLAAALVFFWQRRDRRDSLRWHALMWLPLALMVYALGSMAWSHTYLGAVEAIRWFIFSVLLWLGLNTLTRGRTMLLAWGVHGGVVLAGVWAALQFWMDLRYIPQGPNPASTFANRNFYAEFAACTIPFSALLLARARGIGQIALLATTSAFVIVTIMMTGTRSALVAMWVQLLLVLPVVGVLYRRQFEFNRWSALQRIMAIGLLLATIAGLGMIHTGNARLIEEHRADARGLTALERGFKRTASITVADGSLGVRFMMWRATSRIIQARPLSGVGAGAWEVNVPLYTTERALVETDYDYVHNEFLQLLAEYGLTGWIFLMLLMAYLLRATWQTLRDTSAQGQSEAPLRAVALTALLALFIVSNAGFPWRLASTCALFALCLAILAASDAQRGDRGFTTAMRLGWRPAFSQGLAVASIGCLALAGYIAKQAIECESRIVRAYKIALAISQSGDHQNPAWAQHKADAVRLVREGIDINPHYRKLTPRVADEMARWGDWKNATWVWETVAASRPYVVVIMTNIARGHALAGNMDKALEYVGRARKVQPAVLSARSLEVVLLSRNGQEPKALMLAREALAENSYDYDLVNAAFVLGWRGGDFELARKAMDLRMKDWPASRADGYAQLGNMYLTEKRPDKALESFRQAVQLTPEAQRKALLPQIPQAYWPQAGLVR